ncbi:hypothetical protein P3T18_001655 [Paraburkholderia sp. GAS199]|uniref:hypothetical protein n=1 Tax=Paraburkholderia sp. GAS199 TaxID=3035126 RepID=UPI003D1BAF9D
MTPSRTFTFSQQSTQTAAVQSARVIATSAVSASLQSIRTVAMSLLVDRALSA